MVRHGNGSVLNVHGTVAGSCVPGLCLWHSILLYSATAIGAELSSQLNSAPIALFLFPLSSSQGPPSPCGCLSLMEMFILPAPWPGVVLHFPRRALSHHTFVGAEVCVSQKAVQVIRSSVRGQWGRERNSSFSGNPL